MANFPASGFTTFWQDPRVVMITAPNAGPKTLEGSHTYVVGAAEGYVIDPGPDIPAHVDVLVAWVNANIREPRAILLTHGHPDHAAGAASLSSELGLPIWASSQLDTRFFELPPRYQAFQQKQGFAVDGDTLRVMTTPGHSEDHVAFWLEGAKILFSGDTILGRGTTLIAPPEGNMARYLKTLEVLQTLRANIIAPGHGPIITEPKRKIQEYTDHRQQRERQLIALLRLGPARVPDVVAALYADIDPELQELAAGSVTAQLNKLTDEGRVVQNRDQYRLA